MSNVKRFLALLTAFVAISGYAQESYEYDRVSGGELHLMTKGTKSTSGTLGLKRGDGTELWNATFGGTVLQDRVWFFGAVEKSENRMFVEQQQIQPVPSTNYLGKADIQLGDRHRVDAAAVRSTTLEIPSNFLALRYTGIVTNNMFFTASFSSTKVDGARMTSPALP